MFKDVFALKKNSWHAKLMKYIWTTISHKDFSHMCPYFWLSILNVIIVVPVFLYRISISPIVKFISSKMKSIAEKQKAKNRKILDAIVLELKEKQTEEQVYTHLLYLNNNRKIKLTNFVEGVLFQIDWDLYSNMTREPDSYFLKAYVRVKRKLQDLKEEKKKKEVPALCSNKERINKILKIAKPIGKIFIYVISCTLIMAAAYGVYLLGLKAVSVDPMVYIWALLIVLGATAVAVFIVMLVNKMKVMDLPTYENSIVSDILNFLWKIIKFIPYQIYCFIKLLINILKNSCPAIDWKE